MADRTPAPEHVRLSIDGVELSVPRGTMILEAARSAGTLVPHYCYHPGLSSPAQCRLCLVELEGAPKLVPSCVTEVQEGQVVHTGSEPALRMREGVLEFYLANHPLDCPICDQSGECKLQDYVFAEGRARGRSREPKRVFGRDDFGGDVLFYGDRCVMCTRCVRFMEEVAGDPLLTVVERGNRSVIDTFFDEGLDGSPYSGNIIDSCPVGALVSKDFLHRVRAWDLEHTPSICASCSQGCNIEIHARDNVVHRLRPRENMEVNGFWMCDYGRGRYGWMNRVDRLEEPVWAPGAEAEVRGWDEVTARLGSRLRGAAGSGEPAAAVASPYASNEALAALHALLAGLGGGEILFRSPEAEREIPLPGFPKLVRRRDLTPNRTGAERLGMRRVGSSAGEGGLGELAGHRGILIVLGDELGDVAGDFGAQASLYLYLGWHPPDGGTPADAILPTATSAETEGSFTNHEGRVQHFRAALEAPGSARPASRVLATLLAAVEGDAVDVPGPPEAGAAAGADGARGAPAAGER